MRHGLSLSKNLKNTITKLENDYKTSALALKIAKDSTDYTLEAADSVIHDLLIAVILVAFVMLFFLQIIVCPSE